MLSANEKARRRAAGALEAAATADVPLATLRPSVSVAETLQCLAARYFMNRKKLAQGTAGRSVASFPGPFSERDRLSGTPTSVLARVVRAVRGAEVQAGAAEQVEDRGARVIVAVPLVVGRERVGD